MRRLSLGTACKVAYAGILALTLVLACAWDLAHGSHVPFLAFPIVAALASLAVVRRARVYRFRAASAWVLLLNYGILGLAFCAVSFASTQ